MERVRSAVRPGFLTVPFPILSSFLHLSTGHTVHTPGRSSLLAHHQPPGKSPSACSGPPDPSLVGLARTAGCCCTLGSAPTPRSRTLTGRNRGTAERRSIIIQYSNACGRLFFSSDARFCLVSSRAVNQCPPALDSCATPSADPAWLHVAFSRMFITGLVLSWRVA